MYIYWSLMLNTSKELEMPIQTRHYFLILSTICLVLLVETLNAQQKSQVLFLGNSYTGFNNLPQLVHDVALSAGDTLVFDSYTPGGYRLTSHSHDLTSIAKIDTGGWDSVVLQGQSREPILETSIFQSGMNGLYTKIRKQNPCATVMPYMTWGRKNGDATYCSYTSVMCTYLGMDTTLRNEYLYMTEVVNGEVAPVSVVWRYIRQHHPSIELYHPDGSHPSTAGSYAAACCFYASIFKKDPTLISFDFGLGPIEAAAIKQAAKIIVYDQLSQWNFKKLPEADFGYYIGAGVNEVDFRVKAYDIKQNYLWDFGDGNTSTNGFTNHSYLADGTYTVQLTTSNCDLQGNYFSVKDTVIHFCSHTPVITYTSQPFLCNSDTIWTQPADSYQWFSWGTPIPETNQFVKYSDYTTPHYSVISTVNGCAELSQTLGKRTEYTNIYFDAVGDPCEGDTVAFAVLSSYGLSGTEIILWYQDNIPLPAYTNEDTLLITDPGEYICKVVDPNADCPIDTTTITINYVCTLGTENHQSTAYDCWSIFPNPTAETISLEFKEQNISDQIQIFNVIGQLVREESASPLTRIDISDFSPGTYFIRLKSNQCGVLKCIKL